MTTTLSERPAPVVRVPAPAAGESLAVDMVQDSNVQLPFNLEDANVARSGNSLVFSLDNGGTVTVNDFFVTGGGELPSLILPEGDEIPAALAFADSGLDLVTAAGPSSRPLSGGTNYSDDPGALLAGLDKYSMLGTDYWGRSTENGEEYRSLEMPGGDWESGAITNLGGIFGIVGAAFEDGYPYQHTGDYTTYTPAQLTFTFTPTGTTVVDDIRISGFPAGTTLYFGDPSDPGVSSVLVTSPNQVFSFTEADFVSGVFFVPPQDSDDDFPLNVEIDIHATSSGLSNTITGSVTVIVDAVADYTQVTNGGLVTDESVHVLGSETQTHRHEDVDGVFISEFETRLEPNSGQGTAIVTVTLEGTFGDYADGSEAHYFLVATSVVTGSGNTLGTAILESSLPTGYTYLGTDIVNGVEYYRIGVDNSLIAAGNGTIGVDVDFEVSNVAEDEHITWTIGTEAREENLNGGELLYDNNTSTFSTDSYTSTDIDVVNSQVTVTVGWASEGNNDAKHLGKSSDEYEYGGTQNPNTVTDGSDANYGAPITFSLSGSIGSAEFIQSLDIGLGAFSGQGSLGYMDSGVFVTLVDESGVLVGTTPASIGGVYYEVTVVGGNLVLTLAAGETGSMTLELVYQPEGGSYDSGEIDFPFNLTVANDEGATAGYSGQSTIVVDAVADMPLDLEVSAAYTGDPYVASGGTEIAQTAAKPNEEIKVSGSANFVDNDGSEHHYLVLSITDGSSANNWYFTGLDNSTYYLDKDGLASIWTGVAGTDLSASASQISGSGAYIMLEVYLNASGEWVLVAHTGAGSAEYTLEDDGSGNWSLSAADAAGITFLEGASFNPSTGDFSYQASVTAPAATTDDTATINAQAVSVEADAAADIEYDRGNNIAITEAETTDVYVSPADSKGEEEHVNAFEDSEANKHVSGSESHRYTESGVTTSYMTVPGLANAGQITFALTNQSGSVEYITEIRFTIDGDLTAQGTLTYNGAVLTADPTAGSYFSVDASGTHVVLQVATGTFGSALTGETSVSLTYTPHNDHNSLDLNVTGYEVDIVNATSFDTATVDKSAENFTLEVDAVAAKPTDAKSEDPAYEGGDDAAQRGEAIEVKFTVTFIDMSDDNEERSLLLEVPGSSACLNSADTSYAKLVLTGGVSLTIDMTSLTSGITITEVTIDGRNYYKISGSALDDYLESITNNDTATVNAELTIKISDDYSPSSNTGNSSIDYRYGAMTQDFDNDDDVTALNDAAFLITSFTVTVATVSASVSVGVGDAYENAHWNAHVGYLDRQDLIDTESVLLKESSAAITVNVTSSDTNEYVSSATFTVSYAAGSAMAGEIPGQFMYMGELISVPGVVTDADGNAIITCTVDLTTGTVTITIADFQAMDGADSSLYFVPDHNYSDQDVVLNYYVTVTDSASGDEKVFTNDADYTTGTANYDYDNTGNQTTIVVDAVAQQAEFSDGDGNYDLHSQNGTEYAKIAPGEKLFFTLSDLDLRGDVTDGSEYHQLNLQQITGYTLNSFTLNLDDGLTLTVSVQDGQIIISHGTTNVPYPTGLNPTGSGANTYLTFNLDDIVKIWNASEGTTYTAGDIGSIDVAMTTPSDGSKTDIHFNITTVDTESDAGMITVDNNKAVAEGVVTVEYSAATPGNVSITGYVYENASEGFENDLTHPLVVSISQLADGNDTVTDFSLSLGSGSNGSFWIFDANADYSAFETDYAAYVNGSATYPSLEALLDQYATEYTSIGLSNIASQITDNVFTGTIIYMPDEDSYSGKDASFSWSITAKDDDSGQEKTISGGGTITTDAVAQTPEDVTTDLVQGQSSTVPLSGETGFTISATFEDSDSTTDHYILIEAEAGWSFECEGVIYSLTNPDVEIYTHTDGTIYYMVPVTPNFGNSDSATVEIDVTATAPSNALYWHMLAGTSLNGQKEFTIQTGALSKDNDTDDGEITYENNVAVNFNDGFSGTLEKGTVGTYTFEQTKPLYEDNRPDKNTGDLTTTATGEFVIAWSGANNSSAVITVPYDSNGPYLTITGPGVSYIGNGQYLVKLPNTSDVTLTVDLSDAYLNSSGAYNDTDLTITSLTFYNNPNGSGKGTTVSGSEVIVDAVADQADITASSNYYDTAGGTAVGAIGGDNDAYIKTDSIVGGGDDNVAYVTITADFYDTDGSESMYLLVEAVPAWKPASLDGNPVSYEEIYYDGKLYYQIEVSGDGVYIVGMEYVAPINPGDDIYKKSEDGVNSYELTVGVMTKETATDGEVDASNNVAYNFGTVIVQVSPIDSSGAMSFDSAKIVEGADITFSLTGIATDKHDVLESLEITAPGGAGDKLYIVDQNGAVLDTLTADSSGLWTIDPTPSSPYSFADLADGSASFKYKTDGSTEDVTFSWTGTVKDEVSGASGEISGSKTIIVDAVADGSDVDVAEAEDADGNATNYAAIVSGGSATISMTVAFEDNLNSTEEHWIVLQQVNGYPLQSVEIDGVLCNVVTKLGSDGNLYYAVNVSGMTPVDPTNGFNVKFTVSTPSTSSDLSTDLQIGTITVETSIDSSTNHEPDYTNNYDLNVSTVTVHTGVVETDPNAVTLTVTGAEEDAYTLVDIGGLATLAANHESATIEITDSGKGAFYTFDGTSYTPVTTLVYGGTYYYKAIGDWSGSTTIQYTVTIRDDLSGATETLATSNTVTVTAVADTPTALASATEPASQDTVHTAIATATLKATFGDYTDGSESHSFILALPQGVSISTSGYTLLIATRAAALFGAEYNSSLTYYQTTVTNTYLASVSGEASRGVSLTIDHTYTSGDVSYWAYASDTGGGVTDTALSAPATIELDMTGITLNVAPTVVSAGEQAHVSGLVATGQVDTTTLFTDADGDTVLISQVAGTTSGAAGTDVDGTYGTLNIDQDGNYAYAVNTENASTSVITIAEGTTDTFNLYGDDGHGGTKTSGADLAFTYDATYHIGTDGSDTIHAVDSVDNLIIGGAGDDILHGGSGADTFFWDTSHFGTTSAPALDIVNDFEYGKDVLLLEDFTKDELDLSSYSDILDFFNDGMGTFTNNTLELHGEDGDWSISAEFRSATSLFLTISSDGAMQEIEVNFTGSAYTLPTDESEAAEIVKNLIEQGAI